MLTTFSYTLALVLVVVAGLVGLWALGRLLPGGWPRGLRWGVLGALAGLLLTPALPNATAATQAPALIVALFNTLFAEGWSAAVPAVARLLITMLIGAVVGGLAGSLFARRQATASESVAASDA